MAVVFLLKKSFIFTPVKHIKSKITKKRRADVDISHAIRNTTFSITAYPSIQ